MYIGLHIKQVILFRFSINLNLFPDIFEKYSNIKFHENSSNGSRVVPCGRTGGRTDITKLITAFRNFSNVPKSTTYDIGNALDRLKLYRIAGAGKLSGRE